MSKKISILDIELVGKLIVQMCLTPKGEVGVVIQTTVSDFFRLSAGADPDELKRKILASVLFYACGNQDLMDSVSELSEVYDRRMGVK